MGFLKFLKREKKQEALEDFDLPPAPPLLEGFEGETHEMPDFEKISAPDDFPKFDFPENEELPQMEEDKQSFGQSFPEIEEKMAPIEPVSVAPAMSIQPMPSASPAQQEEAAHEEEAKPVPRGHPRGERGLFRHHERKAQREISGRKEVYVRVDKFKSALQSISMMRSDLRKSEEALMKLESIKSSKDRSYDKVRSSIHDIQNKLIFVDKTLFRGD